MLHEYLSDEQVGRYGRFVADPKDNSTEHQVCRAYDQPGPSELCRSSAH